MSRSRTVRRPLVTALTVLCGAAATVGLLAAPAAASVTQTGSCVDGGGTRWNVKAVWGDTYRAADGVTRVRLDYAGWTTPRTGTVPTDARIRSYDGSGAQVQDRRWSGSADYARGTVFRSVNPLNPPSAPGRTRLRLTVGVAGDGKASCSVNLLQPPAPTPSPTPTPSTPTTSSPAPSSPAPSGPASSTSTPSAPAPSSPAPSTPAPSTPAPSTSAPSSASDRYESDVLAGTNVERARVGLVPLSPQECVDSYAEAQAQRMAAEGRMYHQDLMPVLSACRLSTVGENVAYGYRDGAAVMVGWMNSPGHKANILRPEYRLLGVGAAQDARGVWYAAQVFGTLR